MLRKGIKLEIIAKLVECFRPLITDIRVARRKQLLDLSRRILICRLSRIREIYLKMKRVVVKLIRVSLNVILLIINVMIRIYRIILIFMMMNDF